MTATKSTGFHGRQEKILKYLARLQHMMATKSKTIWKFSCKYLYSMTCTFFWSRFPNISNIFTNIYHIYQCCSISLLTKNCNDFTINLTVDTFKSDAESGNDENFGEASPGDSHQHLMLNNIFVIDMNILIDKDIYIYILEIYFDSYQMFLNLSAVASPLSSLGIFS